MKCVALLALAMFGCALAQNAVPNDGRYYPEYYETKWDDGRWRPDGRGKYNDGQYRPGGQGGSGGFGAGGSSGGFGAGGSGGFGAGGSGGFGAGGAGALGSRFGNDNSGSSSFGASASSGSDGSGSASVFGAGAGAGGAGAGAGAGGFGAGGFGAGGLGGGRGGSGAGQRGKGSGSGSGSGDYEKIKEQVKQFNEDGYYYKYANENNIEAAESGRIDNRNTDDETLRAKGYYEYVGDDGQKYRVDYVADENGFQPVGDHLPTPPPVPEEIARALEYISSQQRK
uniref:Uncharacterized protein n=1 Tax=Anopheles albimanus TaxID=7167 RepID=A0A182F695_ANOAL